MLEVYTSTAEIWKPVVGFEGLYEVSDKGQVRSLDRHVVHKNGRIVFWKGQIRSLCSQPSGHMMLSLCKGSEKSMHRVHSLVIYAFVGPRPVGMEIRHLNGNPRDNRIENLTYGTSSENRLDAYTHGGRKSGADCHLAKLDKGSYAKLIALKGTVSSRIASLQFGISDSHTRRIWRGEAWRHERA